MQTSVHSPIAIKLSKKDGGFSKAEGARSGASHSPRTDTRAPADACTQCKARGYLGVAPHGPADIPSGSPIRPGTQPQAPCASSQPITAIGEPSGLMNVSGPRNVM